MVAMRATATVTMEVKMREEEGGTGWGRLWLVSGIERRQDVYGSGWVERQGRGEETAARSQRAVAVKAVVGLGRPWTAPERCWAGHTTHRQQQRRYSRCWSLGLRVQD